MTHYVNLTGSSLEGNFYKESLIPSIVVVGNESFPSSLFKKIDSRKYSSNR